MPNKKPDHTRRRLLKAAAIAAASGPFLTLPGMARAAAAKFRSYPFTLGVASGDPTPDGAVIWTRLAPAPLAPDGGLPPESYEVGFEVATDERFRNIVGKGATLARPDLGHSVRVELRNLRPATEVYYRFFSGSEVSPTGRLRTAPAYGADVDRFRIAWASCQHYEQGYFTPYQDMVSQTPDLVIHTGDYIYESSWGPQIRRHAVPEPVTLADYRMTHALYKLDTDLQAAHAAAPWLFIWDDHEVDNDYAGDVSEEPEVSTDAFFARRVAAYRAFFENQPLRNRSMVLPTGDMRIWGASTYGNMASVYLTDGRQYRSPMACPTEDDRGGNVIAESCPELDDESRTYLGSRQERWLARNFGRGPATWNLLIQPTLLSPYNGAMVDGEPGVWSDGWSGYPAARDRLTRVFASRENSNPIVLGGDTHCYWVSDIKTNYDDESASPVGTEFVTTSITSLRGGYDQIASLLPQNPHIKHFDSREHGYGLVDLYADRAEVDLRVVGSPRTRSENGARSQAKFVVEAGRPGAERA